MSDDSAMPMNALETAVWAAAYVNRMGGYAQHAALYARGPKEELAKYDLASEVAAENADAAVLLLRRTIGTGRHVPDNKL